MSTSIDLNNNYRLSVQLLSSRTNEIVPIVEALRQSVLLPVQDWPWNSKFEFLIDDFDLIL